VCITESQSPTGQFKIEGETENEKESSEKGIEAGQREAVEDRHQDRQITGAVTAIPKKGCCAKRGSPFLV
jgi:hypothetical protein